MITLKKHFKIIIVGDTGVGKTSLIRKFSDKKYNIFNSVPTIGVDFITKKKVVELEGCKYCVQLHVWDTAGQEKFRSIVNTYYRGSDCAIICFSFKDISKSINNIEDYIINVKSYCKKECDIIIVGTKFDQEIELSPEQIEYIESLCFKYNVDYLKCSAKTNEGIDIIFENAIKCFVENNCEKMTEIDLNNESNDGECINLHGNDKLLFGVNEEKQTGCKC